MNTRDGLFTERPDAAEKQRVTATRDQAEGKGVSLIASVHDDQIHALVQQLFFRHESKPERHVGFATVEASTETAMLCLEVAGALAEESKYDVGLIDAYPDSVPLETKLQIPSPNPAEATWPIAPRLWMVPRQSWLPENCGQRITDQNLSRLRELTTEFDFSILWCAPGLLAHGKHWPDLRWPGARAGRQQNKTPRRRSNQGSAEQGASSSAWDSPCRASFPCAARPVSESVNLWVN